VKAVSWLSAVLAVELLQYLVDVDAAAEAPLWLDLVCARELSVRRVAASVLKQGGASWANALAASLPQRLLDCDDAFVAQSLIDVLAQLTRTPATRTVVAPALLALLRRLVAAPSDKPALPVYGATLLGLAHLPHTSRVDMLSKLLHSADNAATMPSPNQVNVLTAALEAIQVAKLVDAPLMLRLVGTRSWYCALLCYS